MLRLIDSSLAASVVPREVGCAQAVARPRPLVPPVTRAILPASLFEVVLMDYVSFGMDIDDWTGGVK